jgi:hypothetical protein
MRHIHGYCRGSGFCHRESFPQPPHGHLLINTKSEQLTNFSFFVTVYIEKYKRLNPAGGGWLISEMYGVGRGKRLRQKQ